MGLLCFLTGVGSKLRAIVRHRLFYLKPMHSLKVKVDKPLTPIEKCFGNCCATKILDELNLTKPGAVI